MSDHRGDWAHLAALADVAGTLDDQAAADRLGVELRRLTAVERDARTARMVIEGPLQQEIERLRARVDEIEAGEIRTKWAVRYGPDDIEACDNEIEARCEAAEPHHSGELVSRTIRYSPWTVTQ